MKAFTSLYTTLDESTSVTRKITALKEYFGRQSDRKNAWALYYLLGNRVARILSPKELRQMVSEVTQTPSWLVEECYSHVGDLAETITLLIKSENYADTELSLSAVSERLVAMKEQAFEDRSAFVREIWSCLSKDELFIFNKLLTGSFRVGVQRASLTKALSHLCGASEALVARRMTAQFLPTEEHFRALTCGERPGDKNLPSPFPFFLAYPLEGLPEELGDISDWHAEWKWDGIRSQVLCSDEKVFIWSRGEESVTHQFPEIVSHFANSCQNAVFDGEIVVWDKSTDRPAPFLTLQKRLNVKKVSKALLESHPVIFIAYDLLQFQGEDLREVPFSERRRKLKEIVPEKVLVSETLSADSWQALLSHRERARGLGVEGLMLKRESSTYGHGRRKGSWYKWKVEPFSADMVLVYAQSGHGRRAGLYTDFTFAVKDGDKIVPVTKAYSGLTDKEFEEVNRFIRSNTKEKFGPVRSVKPELVFEIAFDAIQESTRHKCGVALRFPRILRWRKDKPVDEIDSVDTLRSLQRVRC